MGIIRRHRGKAFRYATCILKPRARYRLPPSQREGSECCSCGHTTLAILRVSVCWWFIPTSAGIAVISRDAGVGHDPARCTVQRVQHVCRCVSESVHNSIAKLYVRAQPILIPLRVKIRQSVHLILGQGDGPTGSRIGELGDEHRIIYRNVLHMAQLQQPLL